MGTKMAWLALGVILGGLAVALFFQPGRPAQAANDRYEDFAMCTGPVTVSINNHTDGVWLLDYRSGKLLGTIIDRVTGKIANWAEVDLVTEFAVAPRQNVHFMMTTGAIAHGQAALYVAETTTGKFAVYTMGARPDGRPGIAVRRHDMSFFRQPPAQQGP
jgi:hypothetical protein